jgi:hypothetical protein
MNAVDGHILAAAIDYLALRYIPKNTTELGLQVGMTLVVVGPGASALKYAVKELGLDPKLAKLAVEEAKQLTGRGGADNVLFDTVTGDIIAPETGEIIGNLRDFH